MTPYYSDEWLTVYAGDCRAVMASMEPESVHCVVTSPPYWGLRDYGTATWDGGAGKMPCAACDGRGEIGVDVCVGCGGIGYIDCTHVAVGATRTAWANSVPGPAAKVGKNAKQRNETKEVGGTCGKCGARRIDNQLGLEPTPEEYVANLVDVFREVRRVLRADGTVWLNLGDSYAGSGATSGDGWDGQQGAVGSRAEWAKGAGKGIGEKRHHPPSGLKPKDLVGIPWRVALALQADGWYLRSDIIWAKPNPMPESVTDRPTKSHEYLFLLSKSPRYYYDADAVREAADTADRVGERRSYTPGSASSMNGGEHQEMRGPFVGLPLNPAGRNLRSVWTIATQPYPGAHFATFPRKLVEPCIKAGSPEGGVVLDCFAGSGTTGLVAQSLSRRAVLIDLNADYLIQAMGRNRDIPLGLVG